MKAIAPMCHAGFPDSLRGEPSNPLMLGEVEICAHHTNRWPFSIISKRHIRSRRCCRPTHWHALGCDDRCVGKVAEPERVTDESRC